MRVEKLYCSFFFILKNENRTFTAFGDSLLSALHFAAKKQNPPQTC